MLIHPTADTEIRVWQAQEIVDAAGADDVTYVEMQGALHYLEGDRVEAMQHVVDWLTAASPDRAVPGTCRSGAPTAVVVDALRSLPRGEVPSEESADRP